MRGAFWSVEDCGWQPCPGARDALVTPWSAHGLPVPDLPPVGSGAALLRLPSRQEVVASAVPLQREPAAVADVAH